MIAQYTTIDYVVFAGYILILFVSGWFFNRKTLTTKDYFLGGNKMPMWVVAISVLATSQSAATFLGGPDQGYRGDLTYLATNIAGIIAAIFVATFLLPKFYQYKVFTVYELLSKRFGENTKLHAGVVYLFGRIFASGARLYMAAIAIAMILFGDIQASSVMIAIAIITSVGLAYTIYGGIKSVIYSDVIQCSVYVLAAILVLGYLYTSIPADFSTIIDALRHPSSDQASKLTLLNMDVDFGASGVFNIWSVFTGFVLLNIAAYGLDQDMTQRMLTCKDAKQGTRALISSIFLGIPIVFLFICIGMLLFIYYDRPDLMMQDGNPSTSPEFAGQTVTIFMHYVLTDLPNGIKAVVTIGIVAAALSTLNSGLNSMSSVIVQDLYRDWKIKRQQLPSEIELVKAGRVSMLVVATALASMACLCFYWQQHSDMPLLAFALSVMIFSYNGLLGVYFVALFSKRGNGTSIILALIVGFCVPLLMQPYIMSLYLPEEYRLDIGFTWQLLIGTSIATLVCWLGSPNAKHQGQFQHSNNVLSANEHQ